MLKYKLLQLNSLWIVFLISIFFSSGCACLSQKRHLEQQVAHLKSRMLQSEKKLISKQSQLIKMEQELKVLKIQLKEKENLIEGHHQRNEYLRKRLESFGVFEK